MSPDDPRHGTTAGHYAHLKAGESACLTCVRAKTRYEKGRSVYGNRMVPAIGTRRRVHALKALGHSGADIAARLGVTYQAVGKIEHGSAERMFAATAEAIGRVFEDLCMTEATGYHATRIRNQAARQGYVPPLAWNDIDDPDETPTDWQYREPTRADQLEELVALGEGITKACEVLDVSRIALEKWCERNGMRHLYVVLVGREYVKPVTRNQHSREVA